MSRIVPPTAAEIAHAAELLRAGGLVALPTETVYGLGAHAFDERAVARVFEVKGRPRFDPLIVHVAEQRALDELVADIPPAARKLADQFWPGPLTLVLNKRATVPDLVTAGCPTVAVRIPDHPVALELLRTAALPVAAPSANLFGRISPTTAAHVEEQLGDAVDLILDGGPCRVGVESTVLQVTANEAVLLRPGGTPLEEIEALVGRVIVPPPQPVSADAGLVSPGTLPQHYAPRTPLVALPAGQSADGALTGEMSGAPLQSSPQIEKHFLPSPLAGEGAGMGGRASIDVHPHPQPLSRPGRGESRAREVIATAPQRVGLLVFTAPNDRRDFTVVEVLSPSGDLREAAARFFAALRRLDAAGLDLIVAETFPEHGLGRALNDRLRRAAHD